MALSDDLVTYYDNLDEMFGTAGWRTLVDEMKNRIYELQADALDAKSWERVNELRGEARQLAYLVNLEAVSDATRDQLEEAALEDEKEQEGIDASI